MKRHARPAGPTVAWTKELAGDPSAWIERACNPRPNGGKNAGRHQRQSETTVDQVAEGPFGVFEARNLARKIHFFWHIVASGELVEKPRDGEAVSQAVAFAGRFRNASTLAIGMTKNMLNRSFERDLATSLDLEASAQAIANNSEYHRDAVARFLDKQPTLFDWEKQEG